MEQTLRAIVLSRRDVGESDRRLTILSEERGLIHVVAKGARKVGSRLAGCSEPLAVCEIQIARGKLREFVTQAQPITSFPGLREDFDRLSCGLALLELVASTTPGERPDPDLFTFLIVALKHLELHSRPLAVLAWAEVRLLEISGHLPSFGRCVETGATIREGDPWFSPTSGGYLSAERAHTAADRIRTRAEVLIGLDKLANLEEPPPNLRFAEDCLRLLHLIWHEIAHSNLPASEQLLKSLQAFRN